MSIVAKRFKDKRSQTQLAQQLVEFMLVVPFMIMIFGILLEYAYALSINLTLAQGVNTVASSIYRDIKPNMTRADIDAIVLSKVTDFMRENRAPINSENGLDVQSAIVGNNAFFLATYTYVPAFNMPILNIYFMPKEFHFKAAAMVPASFLNVNDYSLSGHYVDKITSDNLTNFWGDVGTNPDCVNSPMRSSIDLTKGKFSDHLALTKTLFFVNPVTVAGVTTFNVITWNGTDLLAGGRIDLDSLIGTPYFSAASPYTNIIIYSEPLGGLTWDSSKDWISGCNPSVSLAVDTQSCTLKDALSLSSSAGSLGTYDTDNTLDLSSYGPLFSQSNRYQIYTIDALVVVHDPAVVTDATIKSLIGFSIPPTLADNAFGEKVTVVP